MKSIIFSLLILCSIISASFAQNAYGIWDDENGVATVGTIDLNTAKSTGMFSHTGYSFNSNNAPDSLVNYNEQTTGISSYNPVSGLITYIATHVSSGSKYLVSVDTFTWTIFNNSLISSSMNFGNLAYDLTSDSYNLFATYYNNDGNLHVVKLSVSESYYKPVDTITNVQPNATGCYLAKSELYGVCYQDNSLIQHCNYYNLSSIKVISKPIATTGVSSDYAVSSSPYAMAYIPQSNQVISYININRTAIKPYVNTYQFFWVGQNSFVDNYWADRDVRINQYIVYTPFGDFNLPRVYQFAKTYSKVSPFGFSMYTYSTYNNQWARTQPTNVGVLNAWGVKDFN